MKVICFVFVNNGDKYSMKFRMFFPALLIDFPNSKLCLIGECSIAISSEIFEYEMHLLSFKLD